MALPERFSQLRKQIFKDHLIETWRDVVNELNTAVEEVNELGSNAIPRVSYDSIQNGNVNKEVINRIKTIGSAVIDDAVPDQEALAVDQSIKDYINTNHSKVRGFPSDDIQVCK